ncbi:hypothetical protein NBE98_09600 [Clostridium swellfunianum]|uniref:hypothetical protein n=1 Tax=Clostridium swellfunianum TaxID=1367462 RepID=UPI00202E38AB|nr:hypothetical protein [Clostridium swellfunianum]MCM0648627.1 hypothetical protein [Clostridium swellfunianum]
MEYYGFFNGTQEYGQEEFNRYFDNIYESGVSVENGSMTLAVTKTVTGVQVEKGFSIIKGFYLYNDSVKAITIPRNANYDRIDRIVVRLNLSSSTVSIALKQGTAGSNPQIPALQRDNLVYELSLAQVLVPRSGDFIVTDERFRQDFCGAIRPKNLTEFNDMINGLQEQFDRWFNSQQTKGWRNIYIQSTQPTPRVAGSIWIKTL